MRTRTHKPKFQKRKRNSQLHRPHSRSSSSSSSSSGAWELAPSVLSVLWAAGHALGWFVKAG
jgi:hypothetical protein